MKLTIRKYSWQQAPEAVRSIRQRVFIDEQQVPAEQEWDATDEIADHYLAVTADQTPVGVARMFPSVTQTAQIGRMAILPEFRSQGAGEQLLHHLIRDAAGHFRDVQLSAQQYAIPFYQRCGFHVCSDLYQDVGIPHVDMRCLAPTLIATQSNGRAHPMVLGKDTQPWQCDTDAALADLTDALSGQAGQRIWLYEHTLEHARYDRHRFHELLSTLARQHRLADVRLLIHDDKPLAKRRHQIVELMRRLPSRIQLRVINPLYPHAEHPFLLVDRAGILARTRFGQPQGVANFSARHQVKQAADQYQRMWDTASPSRELRELAL
ncbi:GNAT family N-acetyltransferase [Marinobacter sp. X15-166B]|uniref:GNAT family N-acetyltransferase n=1 Tax=Marinobacter sp. X15-166B TaxID=1897620 RepID=UPI00085C59F3|nr:GNAT family N-acetyltransferase [Marinobacter sp. X15-166B]OEY67200.1 GNAT family N-acetyltransferase [Marinobacter sp. X15-166B]